MSQKSKLHPCSPYVLMPLLGASVTAAAIATYKWLSLRRQVNSPAALLQQYKPLHERTYEQQRLVDEYLMMHYGETVTGKYKDNASSNSSSASSSSSSSKCTIDLGTENPLLEAVDFGNFTLFDADARKSVSPSALFPYFALDFPARVARVALHFWNQTNQGAAAAAGGAKKAPLRALDVGCAVGRTTFELAAGGFDEVIGIDYSHAFVNAANALKQGEALPYSVALEGNMRYTNLARAPASADKAALARCAFMHGDATNLDIKVLTNNNNSNGQQQPQLFSCIVAANLLDRLPSPRAFLRACGQLLAKGGVLVLTSPYTWMTEYTPVSEFLGSHDVETAGKKKDQAKEETKEQGKPAAAAVRSSFEDLKAFLTDKKEFALLSEFHLPFLIRETARKHQFTFAHCTVWQRV